MKDYRYIKDSAFHCKAEDKLIINKKVIYCKNCIRAIQCNDGVVCPHGLNDKW